MSQAWDLWRSSGIRVGTASWTDKTLLEPDLFYPRGVSSAAERLRFYAEHFPIVEVDATYYALPAERNAELWAERTPSDFVFNVKAFGFLTHHPIRPASLPKDLRTSLPEDLVSLDRVYRRQLTPELVEACWERFLSAMGPLARAGKLGALLFQFPEWFPPSLANRNYIAEAGLR